MPHESEQRLFARAAKSLKNALSSPMASSAPATGTSKYGCSTRWRLPLKRPQPSTLHHAHWRDNGGDVSLIQR